MYPYKKRRIGDLSSRRSSSYMPTSTLGKRLLAVAKVNRRARQAGRFGAASLVPRGNVELKYIDTWNQSPADWTPMYADDYGSALTADASAITIGPKSSLLFPVNVIDIGNTASTRIGSRVNVKSLFLRLNFVSVLKYFDLANETVAPNVNTKTRPQATAPKIRVMIILDKQPNEVAVGGASGLAANPNWSPKVTPTAGPYTNNCKTILTEDSANGMAQLQYRDRFSFLFDKTFFCSQVGLTQQGWADGVDDYFNCYTTPGGNVHGVDIYKKMNFITTFKDSTLTNGATADAAILTNKLLVYITAAGTKATANKPDPNSPLDQTDQAAVQFTYRTRFTDS